MSDPEPVSRIQPRFDRARIVDAVREILEAIGDDPEREGLKGTPDRVADMYAEIFSGIDRDASEELNVVFDEEHDEMILIRDIPLYSVCEHHLLPWVGQAHVAYIPNEEGHITGLSKIARVVDTLSKRPQVQERLTTQIAAAIEKALDPRGVLVILEAEHLCMTMRGIKKPGAQTVTSAVRGIFRRNEATRAEAMGLIRRA
jgi:GTP cyclohydrolase I